MNKKYILGLVCIAIVAALVIYASVADKKASTEKPAPATAEETDLGVTGTGAVQQPASSKYPAFVQTFINTHSTGQVIKFNLNNNTYYSFRTSFASGAGTTLYDKNGNLAANCAGAVGPEEKNELCKQSGMGEVIWKR